MTEIFEVETSEAQQSFDLTERVREIVKRAGVEHGLCQVMVLHSTCAIAVNETADPNIGRDVVAALARAVPARGDWLHDQIDDNAAAHIKASILGPSEILPVARGELHARHLAGHLALRVRRPAHATRRGARAGGLSAIGKGRYPSGTNHPRLAPDLVVPDREGRPYLVKYHELPALLLNELEEAEQRSAAQARRIEHQEQAIAALQARLTALELRAHDRSREEVTR